ncbi:sulfite exporter TauE/SafE family protein [Breznakiellaceae bacterium SP9]
MKTPHPFLKARIHATLRTMNILNMLPYQFTPRQWAAVFFCCICFGISKTGISGMSTVAIPLFALLFGAKQSTGVVLPILCFADLIAVVYYRRHAEWKYIVRLVPWALAGFALALWIDRFITSDKGFKLLIGVCVLAGLAILVWNDRRKSCAVPAAWWFSAVFGILGGFSTMVGNSAGPIMAVFLLSMRLPKASYIGTAAWFFLIINYLKLPLQYFAWHNISGVTLLFDVCMIPFLLIGAALGIAFVKHISEAHYRIAVYALTLISTVLLFI